MSGEGKKIVLSYSCGKDSTLALHRVIKEGYKPCGLIVTANKKTKRSWFHGVPINLLNEVSDSLGIPLILAEGDGEDYGEIFEKALLEAKNRGAEFCVFGDIDIEDHRTWCTERCDNVGIGAIFPLWKEERIKVVSEFIKEGYKAIIKVVDLERLPETFLGEILTREIVEQIQVIGADPCGENGEYHTFVFDGPIFGNPINFIINGIDKQDQYKWFNIS